MSFTSMTNRYHTYENVRKCEGTLIIYFRSLLWIDICKWCLLEDKIRQPTHATLFDYSVDSNLDTLALVFTNSIKKNVLLFFYSKIWFFLFFLLFKNIFPKKSLVFRLKLCELNSVVLSNVNGIFRILVARCLYF